MMIWISGDVSTAEHQQWPYLPAPTNGQLNGIPPVQAPCEGFRQGHGQNWEKTKRLEKTEHNLGPEGMKIEIPNLLGN
jgi:hypothetical protein